ncbi:uncharacterized protein LOC119692391 [Plutella xylostella]|uniref:uncharacterized protein LOC119692391 n=1 Tax=Plutella xylostella TaxID=51655 RepID=UPI00203226F4|nr:uncharacterized protein LOC119692391 [Plutella xylostella]
MNNAESHGNKPISCTFGGFTIDQKRWRRDEKTGPPKIYGMQQMLLKMDKDEAAVRLCMRCGRACGAAVPAVRLCLQCSCACGAAVPGVRLGLCLRLRWCGWGCQRLHLRVQAWSWSRGDSGCQGCQHQYQPDQGWRNSGGDGYQWCQYPDRRHQTIPYQTEAGV